MSARLARIVAVATAVLLLLVAVPADIAQAHPEGKAHDAPLPEHASQVMRSFFADQLAPQALNSVSGGVACVGGVAAGYPCDNVDLGAFVSLLDLGGSANEEANDIWGWTDQSSGREFAIIGMTFGTAFVEVTDPLNPVYVGDMHVHGAFGSSWHDIKTYANHAFIVSEAKNHGMQVFDLTQLLNPAQIPMTFGETAHYNKISSAHNLVINEDSGFAYAVGVSGKGSCNGGLHMINISNPTSPKAAGCFSSDGYTHDAQCVNYNGPDTDHQGKEICLNSNEDTLTIVDVTNKANPVQLSRTSYAGVAYTHQGWLTQDQAHFLLDDELDEQNSGHNTRTRVFDVSDLDQPILSGQYDSNNAAIDHNQYVVGDLSFQANYRSGLRILDISDVANANLTEVGFFDVWPADDNAEFNGAWSNYPYFASGTVVVSGIEQGLFVLQPDLGGSGSDAAPTVSVTNPGAGTTVSGAVSVTANAADDIGVNQVEFFAGNVSLGTDSNGTDGWSINWDTSTSPEGSIAVSATATDTVGQTATDSVTVTVDNVADPTVHIGDLDASSAAAGRGGKWNATVVVTVHDSSEAAVAGGAVTVSWSTGAAGSCTTNGAGSCSVTLSGIRRNVSSVTMTVSDVSASGFTYAPTANHDPDGDSDGSSITTAAP